jgi:ppGpp synthetase/RelA/SpoT-type nucleotidyltranferase
MNKEQKEIVKKVNQAYSKLYVLNNIKWTSFRDKLFDMNKQDEKKHRTSFDNWASNHKDACNISDCARLFVVQNIAENFLEKSKYTIKDLLGIRLSCLYSQSIVENYREIIETAWKDEDINYLANLDYISLVNFELYKEYQSKKAA